MSVRLASPEDAGAIGRLLHDFNVEYAEATPGPRRSRSGSASCSKAATRWCC